MSTRDFEAIKQLILKMERMYREYFHLHFKLFKTSKIRAIILLINLPFHSTDLLTAKALSKI